MKNIFKLLTHLSFLGFIYNLIIHVFSIFGYYLYSKFIIIAMAVFFSITICLIMMKLYWFSKIPREDLEANFLKVAFRNCSKNMKKTAFILFLYAALVLIIQIVLGVIGSIRGTQIKLLDVEFFPPTLMTMYYISYAMVYSIYKSYD